MRRAQRVALRIVVGVGIVLLALVVLAAAGIFVFTNTEWGRERSRRLLVSVLGKSVHGIVRMEGIDGDLLRGAILRAVSVTDSAGGPFLRADEVRIRYTAVPLIRQLLRQRLYFDHMTIVRPSIVLDRPPGGTWNFDRIFPRDTTHKGAPGFGSWIRLTDVRLIDGHLVSRAPWAPDTGLTARQRDSVIAFVLGPKGRQQIVRVPGGFQRVSEFRQITGTFPLLQLADPNTPTQTIDVAALHMIALPFRPPAVQVTDLRGRFLVLNDSLYFRGVDAVLAQSRLSGDGRYNIGNNDLWLRLHADPVATNDLLWIDPSIPRDGTGALDFALDWVGPTSDYRAANASLQVARATLTGALGIRTLGDTLTFHDTDLRITRLDTRTIQQLFPTLRSPRQGFLTGRAAVAGTMRRMRVDGDMAFDDPLTGRSRVVAHGTLGVQGSAFVADGLQLTLRPVQVALAKIAAPTLPVGGVLTGSATLNGSTARRLSVQADVTHTDVTGQSRATGAVAYAPASIGGVPWVNADVRLLPLSLATVGRFAPAAGLHGTASGPVRVSGPLRHLTLDATLATPDGGSVAARGMANLAQPDRDKAYDLTLATSLFDASQVSTKAPRTSLTANAALHGRGVTPATIDAVLSADVKTSVYDSLAVDSMKVRVAASNGLLRVDTLIAHIPHGVARVHGTFGLTDAQSGSLRYAAEVDSLGTLSRFFPRDTGVEQPRPGILAERVQRAREDSLRVARATEVQRAISGAPGPKLTVDTPSVVPRNALLGTLRAEGVLRGNVKGFDLDGTANGTDLVALGNTANLLSAQYIWRGALRPHSYMGVGARASGVWVSGFAFDSVVAQGSNRDSSGTIVLAVRQGNRRAYNGAADYVLSQERDELRLNDLQLRFDSTVYSSARPSVIHFGSGGVDVDSLDIRAPLGPAGRTSRILVDGRIPIKGPANARFDITNFDVANVTGLLQSDIPLQGLFSVDASLTGTAENPTIRGAFGAARVTYRGTTVPEVHGTIDYAAQTLHTDMEANLEGQAPFLRAAGTVPVNLAISGVTGPRIPADRQIDVHVDADSLPLDRVPQVTDMIADMRGVGTVHAQVTGTVTHPSVVGRVALADARMNVVPAGITISHVNGNVRFTGDNVVIDSLVAMSQGPIRLSGTVGIARLADPTFALKLTAANARVLDSDRGNIMVDAALALGGRLTAATVDGRVRLLRGIIQIPEPDTKQLVGSNDPALYAVLDTAVESNRNLFPTQSPLLRNLHANVDVMIDRDVFVRSRAANVEIYTDDPLRLTANLRRASFVVDGVVLSDRGEYRFQGRRFTIRRGSATFINTPQLNPTLQITGEYEVQLPGREPITIQIVISGTLQAPQIALTSDANPPISQTDLLSYLAFGQSSSSLLQFGGSGLTTGGSGSGNIVGRAAALAQQQIAGAALGALTNQFAGDAARALGADVFDITPADVSADVGNFLRATQVEFGKYVRSRLFVGAQVRPDPAALQRPGLQVQQILDPRRGYSVRASFEPRFLVQEPSLSGDLTPLTTSVFGLFLTREWRY